jgi:hypothetical protein
MAGSTDRPTASTSRTRSKSGMYVAQAGGDAVWTLDLVVHDLGPRGFSTSRSAPTQRAVPIEYGTDRRGTTPTRIDILTCLHYFLLAHI